MVELSNDKKMRAEWWQSTIERKKTLERGENIARHRRFIHCHLRGSNKNAESDEQSLGTCSYPQSSPSYEPLVPLTGHT